MVRYLDRVKIDLLCFAVFTFCILYRITVIVINIGADIFCIDGTNPLHGDIRTSDARFADCLFGKNIRINVDSALRAAIQPVAVHIAGI